MPRQKTKAESGLLSKGFQETQNDHHYFIYFTKKGKKTTAKTKTSHTKKMKDIPDNLLSQMAKQCHLTKPQFLDLVDCPLSQDNQIRTNKMIDLETVEKLQGASVE